LNGSTWSVAERYYPEGQYSEERGLAMVSGIRRRGLP
jgi:hypothetical protein